MLNQEVTKMSTLTSRQQANVFGRNAITTSDTVARSGERVLNFLTKLQMIRVANEIREVEEYFLVVLECFNEAKVIL